MKDNYNYKLQKEKEKNNRILTEDQVLQSKQSIEEDDRSNFNCRSNSNIHSEVGRVNSQLYHHNQSSDQCYEEFLHVGNINNSNNSIYDNYRQVNKDALAYRLIVLMKKLKDSIKQLCLTPHSVSEVDQQLNQILREFKFQNQQMGVNPLLDLSAISMKDNYEVVQEKNYINHYPYNITSNNCNTFSLPATNFLFKNQHFTHLYKVSSDQKEIFQQFIQKYLEFLNHLLKRIAKYQGQKKLKYLVDTVMKQIFSSIMGLSFQIKLDLHRIQGKSILNKKEVQNFLLLQTINRIFKSKLYIEDAFKALKKHTQTQIESEDNLVHNIKQKIQYMNGFLQKQQQKEKRLKFNFWRKKSHLQKQKQQQNLNENLHIMIELTTKQFIDNIHDCSKWKYIIWGHMDLLLKNISKTKECIFLPVQENTKAQSYQYQKQSFGTSPVRDTVQQISYRYSRYSNYSASSPIISQRSSTIQFENQQSFIQQIHSRFVHSQFLQCLRVGQIRSDSKSSDNSHSLLMIPIRYLNGVVIVRWKRQDNPSNFHNKSQNVQVQSISINGFRNILVAIQKSQSIFTSFLKLQQKFTQTSKQIIQKSYYPALLNQYLSQILNISTSQKSQCSQKKQNQNYKKISLRYEEENNRRVLQFHTNKQRQRKQNETEQTILKTLSQMHIQNAYIFHKSQTQPCISYGNQKPIHLGKDIIQSIFLELQNKRNKKDFDQGQILTIKRNETLSYICPLLNDQFELIGFIQIYFRNNFAQHQLNTNLECSEQQILTNMKEFLLPLMIKTSGNVSCSFCEYKILGLNNDSEVNCEVSSSKYENKIENLQKLKLNFNESLRLCSQRNCQTLQSFVQQLIKQNIPEQKSFMKLFYKQQATSKLDKYSNFSYFTFVDSKTNTQTKQLSWMQFSQVQLSKLLTSEKIIQTYSSAKLLSILNNPKQKTQTDKMIKLVMNSPLFENKKLHLFQMQNTSNIFQLIILPILKIIKGHRNIVGMIWYGKFLTQDRTQEMHDMQIQYLVEMKNCINKNSQFLNILSEKQFLQKMETSLQQKSKQNEQGLKDYPKFIKKQLVKIFKDNKKIKNTEKCEELLVRNIQKFIKSQIQGNQKLKSVKLFVLKSHKTKFNDLTVDILCPNDKYTVSSTEQFKIIKLTEKIQEQATFAFEPLSSTSMNYCSKILKKCFAKLENVSKTSIVAKIISPCLETQKLQCRFLEKLKLQYLSKGQFMNKQYEILKQITDIIIKKDVSAQVQKAQKQKSKSNFFSLKLTLANNQAYMFLLSFSDIQIKNQSPIEIIKNQNFLQLETQNKILEIFQFIKTQFLERQLYAKLSISQKISEKLNKITQIERLQAKQKIQIMQNLLKKKKNQKIKEVINQFQSNKEYRKDQFLRGLQIILKVQNKVKCLMKQFFDQLFAFILSKQLAYKKHSNSLVKIVDKIIVEKTKNLILKSIRTYSISDEEELSLFPAKKVCYQKLKSIQKLEELLQNLVKSKKYRLFFQKWKQYDTETYRLRKLSKTISTQKLTTIISKIVNRSYQWYFSQFFQIEANLFKTLSLVGEECKYIKFMSKKHFTNYIQERLNTGVNSSSCHKINKINLFLDDNKQVQSTNHCQLQFKIQFQKDLPENSLKLHQQNILNFLRQLSAKYFIQSFQRYRELLNIKGKKMSLLLNRIFNISTQENNKVLEISQLTRFFSILKSETYKKNIQHKLLTIKEIQSKQQTLKNYIEVYQKSVSILNQGFIEQKQTNLSQEQKQKNISRKDIKLLRKELDKLEDKEQSLSIQYQIKSKTLAGYRIMKYFQKTEEKQNLNQFLNAQNIHPQNNKEFLQIKKNKLVQKNIDFLQKGFLVDDKMKVNSIFQLGRVMKNISKKQLRSSLYRLNSYSCFVSPANTLR